MENVEEKRDVGLDAADSKLAERAVHLLDDGHEVLLLARELDEEGVVVWGDAAADDDLAVEADAHAAGGSVHLNLAKVRREGHLGILGGDAALHGEALDLDVLLARDADVRQGGTARDENLRLDQIDAGDLLRHRVLNLDAGVHLEKVVAALLVHHELHGTRVAVVDVLRQPHRVVVQSLPKRWVQDGRRRQLHHLLVPPLHRAIALVQVHHVAVAVGENLNLDVPRRLDVPLEEHAPVAERGQCLGRRPGERLPQLTHRPHDAHAAAAAAHRRFEHDRHPELLRELLRLFDVIRGIVGTRDQGQAALFGEGLGDHLVAHLRDGLAPGSDEDDAFFFASSREVCVFGEESVAGVDGLHAVLLGRLDDSLVPEVGPHGGLARVDAVGLVGFVPVRGESVRFAEDGDGAHAELGAGAEGADRDLAAVGAHDLVDGARVGPEDGVERGVGGNVDGLGGWVGNRARADVPPGAVGANNCGAGPRRRPDGAGLEPSGGRHRGGATVRVAEGQR